MTPKPRKSEEPRMNTRINRATLPKKLRKISAILVLFCLSGCVSSRGAEEEKDAQVRDPAVTNSHEVSDDDDVPLIVINEFVASNVTGVVDEGGGTGDWIELYNLSEEDVDLGGFFVSDDEDIPTKALLPAGLVIESRGTILLWADSDTEQGPHHLPFNLKKDGETILLTSKMGDVLDLIDYQNATTDASFARVPDGVGGFFLCSTPTPDASNDPSCGP